MNCYRRKRENMANMARDGGQLVQRIHWRDNVNNKIK
jgi:hypothetical protein